MSCTYFIAYRYERNGYVTDGNTIVEQAEPLLQEAQLRKLERQLARRLGVPGDRFGIVNLVLLSQSDAQRHAGLRRLPSIAIDVKDNDTEDEGDIVIAYEDCVHDADTVRQRVTAALEQATDKRPKDASWGEVAAFLVSSALGLEPDVRLKMPVILNDKLLATFVFVREAEDSPPD